MSDLKCLGGFRNVRSDFDWEGFKLELDETQFDWGTVYEIEVETVSALSSLHLYFPVGTCFLCDTAEVHSRAACRGMVSSC